MAPPPADPMVEALLGKLRQARGLPAEQQLIQQQLERAYALQNTQPQHHTTGWGAAFGGLGDVVSAFMGARREKDLTGQRKALTQQEAEAQAALGPLGVVPAPDMAALTSLPDSEKLDAQAQWQAITGMERRAQELDSTGVAEAHSMAQGLRQQAGQYRNALTDLIEARKSRAAQLNGRAAPAHEVITDSDGTQYAWDPRNPNLPPQPIKGPDGRPLRRQQPPTPMQVVYGQDGAAFQVPTTGGTARPVVTPEGAQVAKPKDPLPVVPGYEVTEGAVPTLDDAKKVKAALASAARMRAITKEMRELHRQHGTELTGPHAVRFGQLVTAARLEGKNIGELGALSGPDMGLVDALIGTDPSSVEASLKAAVGVDNTDAALDGLERWVDSQEAAITQTSGYRRKPTAAEAAGVKREPVPQGLDLSAPGVQQLPEEKRKRAQQLLEQKAREGGR